MILLKIFAMMFLLGFQVLLVSGVIVFAACELSGHQYSIRKWCVKCYLKAWVARKKRIAETKRRFEKEMTKRGFVRVGKNAWTKEN